MVTVSKRKVIKACEDIIRRSEARVRYCVAEATDNPSAIRQSRLTVQTETAFISKLHKDLMACKYDDEVFHLTEALALTIFGTTKFK